MASYRRLKQLMLSLLAGTSMAGVGQAAEPSGTAVHVNPAANASGAEGERQLQAPGDIFQGDLVTTGGGGEVQIKFRDDTRFVVGPNSKVTIDKFVYDPDGNARTVTLDAVKGTFRFIGGRSPAQVYAIHTPTMTIGIRGTIGDFAVRPGGETLVRWVEGTGILCVVPAGSTGDATECKDVQAGDFVSAPPGGGFGTLQPGEITVLTETFFPYAGPNDLGPDFKAPPGSAPQFHAPPTDRHSSPSYQ
jgi:hypothetical protein